MPPLALGAAIGYHKRIMRTLRNACIAALVLFSAGATVLHAESFFLRAEGSGKTYGPYAYAEGTTVGAGQNTFEVVSSGATGFSLRSTRTGEVSGPFAYADGARITLGKGTLILMRRRAYIHGKVYHPNLHSKQVRVYAAPVSRGLLKGFYEIRASFNTLEQRHRAKTAPLRVGPIVTGAPGHARSGYVERSERDITKSRQSVDRQSQPILRKFAGAVAESSTKALNGGSYTVRDLPPGAYLVIAEGTLRADAAGGSLTEPVYWWGTVTLGENDPVTFDLDRTNARRWPELFASILANDPSLGMAPAD